MCNRVGATFGEGWRGIRDGPKTQDRVVFRFLSFS